MTTLIDFLEARLKEDQDAAELMAKYYPPPWDVYDRGWMARVYGDEPFWEVTRLEQGSWIENGSPPLGSIIEHVARHDPARVLREVAAKRAILAAYRPPNEQAHPGPCTESIEHDPEGKDWDDDSSHGPCERHVEAMHARRGQPHASEHILKYLATTWSDHPDYRKEWAA